MRSLVGLVLAVASLGMAGPSAAQSERHCTEGPGVDGSLVIICNDDDNEADPSNPAASDEAYVRTFGLQSGENGLCIGEQWVPLSQVGDGTLTYDEAVALTIGQAETLIQNGYLPCPGVDLAAGSPEAWAREYLRTVVLPVPAPAVAPGEMVVGWAAYLEVGSPLAHRIDEATTPFGPAIFTLTSTVTVDWGDGEVTGPVATTGGPFPDGDLTHTYLRQGAYDIVVSQAWVATWQVGGESGTVDGLLTEAVLEDFPVQEIEAVIVG